MLNLNLLPIKYQREYEQEKWKRFTVFVFIALCVISSIFSALLFSTYIYLKIQSGVLDNSLSGIKSDEHAKNLADIEKQIKEINNRVILLVKTQTETVKVAPVLEGLSNIIKPGIYFKSISLDNSSRIVKVSAFSINREIVLQLEKDLTASDFVDAGSVEIPFKSKMKSKDTDFIFTFKIKQ